LADQPKKMSTFEEMIRDGVAPIKQINPDAQLMRKTEVLAAKDRPATECPHPLNAVQQFIDDRPGEPDLPVNLWQCGVCKSLIWLVDAHGKAVADQ